MNPGTYLVSTKTDVAYWIKRAGVDITRLRANERRSGERRKLIQIYPALPVNWCADNSAPAESQHAERFEYGGVSLVADDHDYLGAPNSPFSSTFQSDLASNA